MLSDDLRIVSASWEDNKFSRSIARERSLQRPDRHESIARMLQYL